MTDKGRLDFAIQLKFIELYGRFPEDNRQINTDVSQALAKQLSVPIDAITSYDPCSCQGQRYRRTIRDFLGYRPSTGADLKQLFHWLCHEALPLDPLARHGRDVAFDWYRTQRIEPPASDELDKTIRSAVRHYETLLQADIYNRLSIDSKVAINRECLTQALGQFSQLLQAHGRGRGWSDRDGRGGSPDRQGLFERHHLPLQAGNGALLALELRLFGLPAGRYA